MPGERVSRTYRGWGAVTAVTRIKAGGPSRRRLWAVLLFGNLTTVAVRPLIRMRVIALGRWTLWPSWRRPRYLLFETDWSGSDQTYIPDFGRIMPIQWQSIWAATDDFPGSLPTTGLLRWVNEIDRGAGHLWTDYDPGASTQTILQALALSDRLKVFLHEHAGASPAELAVGWDELIGEIQGLL